MTGGWNWSPQLRPSIHQGPETRFAIWSHSRPGGRGAIYETGWTQLSRGRQVRLGILLNIVADVRRRVAHISRRKLSAKRGPQVSLLKSGKLESFD